MTERPIFTCQTRLGAVDGAVLDAYAALHGRVERTLFAAWRAGRQIGKLKSGFQSRFGITARQFNAVRVGLEGKIDSLGERRPDLIAEGHVRVSRAEKIVKKLEVGAPGSNQLHQKRRRFQTLKARVQALEAEHERGDVSLCFGTRKLFRAQFDLQANGHASIDAWRDDWHAARARQFFVLGSQDETAGNQTCQASVAGDGSLTLRLRLPDALARGGKFLIVPGVRFAYGHETIVAVLATSRIVQTGTRDGRTTRKRIGSAISYRFLRDDKGWRVFASVQAQPVEKVSQRLAGAIGVIEHLDFQRKKAELESVDPARARQPSSFACRKVASSIKAACFRAGVEVVEVNPAYTSVIGAVQYAQARGISVHMGAAYAIARRGSGLSERPTVRRAVTPVRNGGHVAFDLPARNRSKHVWAFWSNVRTRLVAAHREHYRSGAHRDAPPPLRRASPALGASGTITARSRDANRSLHCSGSVVEDVPY